MMPKHLLILIIILLTACGGGGSSSATPTPEPEPTEPGAEPTAISLLDSIPRAAGMVSANMGRLNLAHAGHSDLETMVVADCETPRTVTLRRQSFDLSSPEFDQILDHRIRCVLAENTSYEINVTGTRANGATFSTELAFSSGTAIPASLTVIDTINLSRDSVDALFVGYVSGALLDELDLPGAIESLLLAALLDISEANWDNLVDPEALYDVRAERVSYESLSPDGSPSNALTGLVVYPVLETAADFSVRDKMIVLSHATGSTPGDLDPGDAWFILANQFAARGYLVVAPDNYGRGGTAEEPETYLMANRTAYNSWDLVNLVQVDTRYDAIYPGTDVTIVGYSQGGHAAVGLYQLLTTQVPEINVREVYSGGAPLDLYQTFRGVLEHIDDSCADGPWCRFVDEQSTIPFATDRILPGFTAYTETGFSLDDLTDGDNLNDDLVTGFLSNDPAFDALKSMLQLNSFPNLLGPEDNFSDNSTFIHLYHSDFDRLVPLANTESFVTTFSDTLNIDFHDSRCNGSGYEVIFNLTDKVGVVHTLCGLSVLDDAMQDLK